MRTHRLDHLGALAGQWDHLAATQALPSPFLRSWWLDHAAGGEPAIICCTDNDGALLGGAAFEIDRIGRGPASVERVRCLGQGGLAPDHLDVISVPGHRREVLGAVGRWLVGRERVIDLDGLAEGCELPFLLDAPVVTTTRAPFVALGEDDPVAALPGQLRNTIKRTLKRLEREGITARRIGPADSERALDTLLALHESRWDEDSEFTDGWDRFRAAARAGMSAEEVVIHELAGPDGLVIASELEIVAGGRASFYQAGRLTDREYRGSGSAMKAVTIRWARDLGCTDFDLLRGDEGYKADWTTGTRQLLRVRTGVGPLGVAAAGAMNTWVERAPAVAGAAQAVRSRLGGGADSSDTG